MKDSRRDSDELEKVSGMFRKEIEEEAGGRRRGMRLVGLHTDVLTANPLETVLRAWQEENHREIARLKELEKGEMEVGIRLSPLLAIIGFLLLSLALNISLILWRMM